MSVINKHGLSRYLPSDIKLQVRQKSGFGCIICGCGIYEYEHIDPPFSDCKSHDPNGITLLCPTCHSKKTRGFLSVSKVKRAMNNPKCLQRGFTNEFIDIGLNHPKVKIGGVTFVNTYNIITIKGRPVIMINPITPINDCFSITAYFFNEEGKLCLSIIKNEWIAFTDNWDIKTYGGKIEIFEKRNNCCLRINFNSENLIIIDKIIFRYFDILIKGDSNDLNIYNTSTDTFTGLSNITIMSEGIIGGIRL